MLKSGALRGLHTPLAGDGAGVPAEQGGPLPLEDHSIKTLYFQMDSLRGGGYLVNYQTTNIFAKF